jgi:hypothetical protein
VADLDSFLDTLAELEVQLEVKFSAPAFGEPYLIPVFGSRKFPIEYYTSGVEKSRELEILTTLYTVAAKLPISVLERFNARLNALGSLPKKIVAPEELSGNCIKTHPANKNPASRCTPTLDKWSCLGCGKSWVPGSYMSATCKKYDYPWWVEIPAIRENIESDIEALGESTKSPIVWLHSKSIRAWPSPGNTDVVEKAFNCSCPY